MLHERQQHCHSRTTRGKRRGHSGIGGQHFEGTADEAAGTSDQIDIVGYRSSPIRPWRKPRLSVWNNGCSRSMIVRDITTGIPAGTKLCARTLAAPNKLLVHHDREDPANSLPQEMCGYDWTRCVSNTPTSRTPAISRNWFCWTVAVLCSPGYNTVSDTGTQLFAALAFQEARSR